MSKIKIESQIADTLIRFKDIMERHTASQRLIHDAILRIEEDTLTAEEIKITKDILHACLSLSFILKENEREVETFMNYHDH
ncbi:hypothetical protein [Leptobacterium sp. I13]|uniref:hypothetical protein n=1 Tax=Leptobacterium meishanense TaxID=3128904 RepID=UPI0030EE46BB